MVAGRWVETGEGRLVVEMVGFEEGGEGGGGGIGWWCTGEL